MESIKSEESGQPKSQKKLLRNGIGRSLSMYWKERKVILFICALAIVLRVVLPFFVILMPKVVIDQVMAQVEPQRFFLIVGIMALVLIILNYLKAFTDGITNDAIGTVGIGLTIIRSFHRLMCMDYETMEDPEFKKVYEKADKAISGNHAPAMNIPRTLVQLLSNIFGLLLYATIIAVVHPLILVVLLITAGINWIMLRRARNYLQSSRDIRSKNYKKLNALSDTLVNKDAAKDVRMYEATGWLKKLYKKQFSIYRKGERKLLSKDMHAQLTDALMILLRDGAAYAFLIWLVLNDEMTLGEFVLVFAAIGALAGWISGILTAAGDLSRACIEMDDIKEMFEYPDKMNTASGISLPDKSSPPSIELKNIGYTYPNAEKQALMNINVKIKPGERIAVVGINGAGKSTLVKLISGLYLPTEGSIYLNDNPAGDYNRDEYYTMFSAVFQDIHMLSASVAENISQKTLENTDREKVKSCLKLTGLMEKINSLPDKEKTLLVRNVNPEAIELSGGEMQKLAMARALYKDSLVIILDEPTAALDPIAENEVYRQYAELTEGKTSIYISHRLASTKFCDRILLLDGNIIAEQGSHDELMELGGIYANMFNIQASYYRDDFNGEELIS